MKSAQLAGRVGDGLIGTDPERSLLSAFGYDHVCVHQVGKEQKGFFEFYEHEILPNLKAIRSPRRRAGSRRRRRR
jgi:hypothetical protein